MKNVLSAFAAIGLMTATVNAAALPSAGMDMNWGLQTTPTTQPDIPLDSPCSAQTSRARAYLCYLMLLKEHGNKLPYSTDFIASPCQATPQPLVDWQTGEQRPVPEPSSACADRRRLK